MSGGADPPWPVRAADWVTFAALMCFRALTWPLNTWTLTRALAPLGGWAAWLIPSARSRISDNLDLVRPGLSAAEKKAFALANGAQTLCLFIEYIRIDKFLREIAVEVEGEEHLRTRPGGAIVVTAHIGNWEAIRAAAMWMGRECGIIYRPFNNRYLDRYIRRLAEAGGRPILQKRGGLHRFHSRVRRGGAMMVLVDQRNSGAPFLDFLGRPAETALAAAELAVGAGAALIPAVARRDLAARRFRVTFGEPISDADPAAMMQRVNDRLSAWIEETPEQWFWVHRRWRTTARSRPRGQTGKTRPTRRGRGG